ncbi:MAG: PEP/pyruvate-binding domain-containing protein, partial [Planctomycetota bacterium]
IADKEAEPTILLGPGRWGTTTPSLGIPVGFHEISNVSVLVEIAYEGGNLMPELSYGTHFFQDLVEADIFYVALFPNKENITFRPDRLEKMPNLLAEIVPESAKYADVVKVCRIDRPQLQILCDVLSQELLCAFK